MSCFLNLSSLRLCVNPVQQGLHFNTAGMLDTGMEFEHRIAIKTDFIHNSLDIKACALKSKKFIHYPET